MVRKISETILDFASPLLGALPRPTDLESTKNALAMAIAAWNAVTLDRWGIAASQTGATRRALEAMPEPGREAALAVFDGLVERKRAQFGDDLRAVGKWEVTASAGGGFALSVDARAPGDEGERC